MKNNNILKDLYEISCEGNETLLVHAAEASEAINYCLCCRNIYNIIRVEKIYHAVDDNLFVKVK